MRKAKPADIIDSVALGKIPIHLRNSGAVTKQKKTLDQKIQGLKNKTGYVLLSQGLPPSTIAAEALHFCVRDENRCFLLAMVTGKLFKMENNCIILELLQRMYALNLKYKDQASRLISTGKLHTSLYFHTQPINVLVLNEP